mmetsp:Transcript_18898/g.34203  ORF Transcript_18898/g.34203 Transcript_18898/m.34203 type:complete len:253 (-) Transcript_18898:203-961(-)|eukprot:CAMPEP_0201884136 /NCGR_PEP_ID=MMETSP0902-20130614/16571_1 /ASSEMBLY_ACC=CAM_ASM_000551 /TAXON_ID=420261 /ORGANISM="Thalassiosira antarctica, Strain CCMP982" /LENGTH=252 /DNA_ID=CAMNT_0048413043 /DNA_START=28 /DNA_END=786 /DNA_ORIENTATION=+
MALRSQSLRIARALSKELHPCAQRSVSSAWRNPRPLCIHNGISSSAQYNFRTFSTKPEEDSEPQSSEGETPSPPPPADDATTDAAESADEITEEDKVVQLESQIKELKDQLLRSLAEQDNTRRIAARDVVNAKSFAISSFAKSLLDTSDNLSRALDAVPEDLRHDHENHAVLANLYEGISMTDDGLSKALAKNGLTKFGEKGEKFDPNMHEALFKYPDPEGEEGNIGQVMKVGFMLNKRVVRPAEVGVIKAA